MPNLRGTRIRDSVSAPRTSSTCSQKRESLLVGDRRRGPLFELPPIASQSCEESAFRAICVKLSGYLGDQNTARSRCELATKACGRVTITDPAAPTASTRQPDYTAAPTVRGPVTPWPTIVTIGVAHSSVWLASTNRERPATASREGQLIACCSVQCAAGWLCRLF